jgi:hypothetical protein
MVNRSRFEIALLFIMIVAMVHVYVRADGLGSVLIADTEYPQRVAHTLLSKVD